MTTATTTISKEEKELIKRIHKERDEKLIKYENILETTRAGKLLLKDKPFVIVAIDEPYFPQVYRLIRSHELKKKRWSKYDEQCFAKLMTDWFELEAT